MTIDTSSDTDSDATTELPVVKPDRLSVHRRRRSHAAKSKPPKSPRAKSQRAPLSPGTLTVLWMLLSVGLLAVWFVSYALLFSAIQQSSSQRVLYAQLREELAGQTAPIGGAITPGDPVAVMQAPSLGLDDEVVVEGTASAQTQLGPGHLRNTPLPGQPGVSVLFGRGVTFGAPFADLGSQVAGTQIAITTAQGDFVYRIDGVRRPGDPTLPPPATDESRLTLVSAEHSGWLRGFAANSTVYVDATLVGKSVAAPGGRPTAVPPDEKIMAGDKSALMPLVLWLQALLLSGILLVWARVRWGSWQTWVIGVPIIIAVLWGTTSTAFVLLPNLL